MTGPSGEWFVIDGEVMPAERATISVLDLGFLRGVGAFETIPTYRGQPHAGTKRQVRYTSEAEPRPQC